MGLLLLDLFQNFANVEYDNLTIYYVTLCDCLDGTFLLGCFWTGSSILIIKLMKIVSCLHKVTE